MALFWGFIQRNRDGRSLYATWIKIPSGSAAGNAVSQGGNQPCNKSLLMSNLRMRLMDVVSSIEGLVHEHVVAAKKTFEDNLRGRCWQKPAQQSVGLS